MDSWFAAANGAAKPKSYTSKYFRCCTISNSLSGSRASTSLRAYARSELAKKLGTVHYEDAYKVSQEGIHYSNSNFTFSRNASAALLKTE